MPEDGSCEPTAAGSAIAWACRQLVLWGGMALAVYLVASYRDRPLQPAAVAGPAAAAAPPAAAPASDVVHDSLVYHAGPGGHVVLDADVDGAPVHFIVDTGATFVTLTPADAAAIGYGRGDLDFSIKMGTANGVTRAAPITLREVRIGQLELEDVPAAVVENLSVSLLGMSFLSRLDHWEMHNGTLTISW